jgi:hypothetical protein
MELHVGSPVARGGLTVFPVFSGEARPASGYEIGMALQVEERSGTPVVGEVVVTNEGYRPALLLEGEILTGGRQHRMVTRAAMIEPQSSQVVEVRCVEEGRWSDDRGRLRHGGRAPVSVRAARDQREVWRRVARYGASPTKSLLESSAGRRAAAEDLVAGLCPVPFQSGVLIGIAGHPVWLEVYDVPGILAFVWPRLLGGLALDAVGAAPIETPGRRARRFVRTLPTATPDATGRATARTHRTRLTALHWRGRAVQTVAVNRVHPVVAL